MIAKNKNNWDEARRRWLQEPAGLPPCDKRRWQPEGQSYQTQLFCFLIGQCVGVAACEDCASTGAPFGLDTSAPTNDIRRSGIRKVTCPDCARKHAKPEKG